MLYLIKIFVFLIDITQETVLKWFGLEHPMNQENQVTLQELLESGNNFSGSNDFSTIEMSPTFSIDTVRLIAQGLLEKLQSGLALSEIDNIIVCIIIIRFILWVFRYNLTTSFLITSIGIISAYIWYRHFIHMLFIYESTLYKASFTYKLGLDSYQLKRRIITTIRSSGFKVRLTNPVGILMYAIENGSIQDLHRIDPISMIIANLPDDWRAGAVEKTYYLVYRKLIPLSIRYLTEFYREISAFASYTLMVRIGKRYCPYHIRWHWTFMLLSTLFEPYFLGVWNRINKYITFILLPQVQNDQLYQYQSPDPALFIEIKFLQAFAIAIAVSHLVFLLYAMLHALCGQYFYIPFLTENVELHIGLRDKYSKYSGGSTAWQNEREKQKERLFPKLWYGWFGRGTPYPRRQQFFKFLQKPFKKIIKKIIKKIKKNY